MFGIPQAYWLVALGTFVVHEVAWLAFNVPYLVMEKTGLWAEYKIDKRSNALNTFEAQFQVFKRQLIGHVTQLFPILLASAPLLLWFGFTTTPETLPTWQTFLFQFLIFNVVEDTGFYWVHRLLHLPRFYKAYHMVHHQYDPPFSLAGEIQHPVEFVFNIIVPLMAGPVLMACISGVHIYTYWIWMSFRIMRGADAHSNHYLPFHPLRLISPIYGGPLYHGIHHVKATKDTNFGGYLFWDMVCGTVLHPKTEK